MNRTAAIFTGFIVLLCMLLSVSCTRGPICSAENSEQLGTSYALANFYPNDFVNYINKNKDILQSKAFRRCLLALKDAYYSKALNAPSRNAVYEQSSEIATRAGAPEMGEQVAEGILQGQGNPAMIAVALEQLALVIDGEQAYESTLLYAAAAQQQYLREVWIQVGGENDMPGFMTYFSKLMYEITVWYMANVASSM